MSTIKQRRANIGGEFGANGEWYEGGKFINTVEDNAKKRKQAYRATRRQEIELRVWEVPPNESACSIFANLSGIEIFDRVKNVFSFNPDLREDYMLPEVVARRTRDIADYNNGKRWK